MTDPAEALQQARLAEGLAEGERGVLRSPVRVDDEPGGRSSAGDGHRERVDDQLGLEVVTHRPADDLVGEHVHHDGEEQVALARLDVGDVGQPEAIGRIRPEPALDQVGRRRCLLLGHRGARLLAAAGDALDAQLAHQPGDPLASDADFVLVAELVVDPDSAVDLVRAVVDLDDQPLQLGIAQ